MLPISVQNYSEISQAVKIKSATVTYFCCYDLLCILILFKKHAIKFFGNFNNEINITINTEKYQYNISDIAKTEIALPKIAPKKPDMDIINKNKNTNTNIVAAKM